MNQVSGVIERVLLTLAIALLAWSVYRRFVLEREEVGFVLAAAAMALMMGGGVIRNRGLRYACLAGAAVAMVAAVLER
jgi:hypothetical protein